LKITKLVCLGDSLTEGYNIDLTKRWTDLLASEVDFPIINSGISGDTTAGMLARFSNDVLSHKPSHLIIMGGTNDIYFDLADKLIISNIKTMLRQAKFHDIQAIIGIPTPVYPIQRPDASLFISEEKYISRLERYKELLIAFATEDGCPYVEFSVGIGEEHMLSDGVHPSEEGQVVMAGVLRDFLGSGFVV